MHKLWKDHETLSVDVERNGHGGGDGRLQDKIFKTPEVEDEFGRGAGIRDGAMSILIGIAARRSIESGNAIKIGDLTELTPKKERS